MQSKCCLITGGAGFIGSHIVDAMLEAGWAVRILDPNCIGNPNLAHVASQVELIDSDFGNQTVAEVALKGVDALLHYASTTTPISANSNEIYDVESNLLNTLSLFHSAIKCGVSRLIFSSSGGTVYGPASEIPISEGHPCQPISSHAIVKRAIESYIQLLSREHGLKYTILRYANPYGPRQKPDGAQGVIAVFAGKIMARQPIDVWGDGSVIRDYIFIDDLVRATMMALNSDQAVNEIFNIGSGVGLSIREIISLVEAITGIEAIENVHPARIFDIPVNVLNIERATKKMSWVPMISMQEGLHRTLRWLDKYIQNNDFPLNKRNEGYVPS